MRLIERWVCAHCSSMGLVLPAALSLALLALAAGFRPRINGNVAAKAFTASGLSRTASRSSRQRLWFKVSEGDDTAAEEDEVEFSSPGESQILQKLSKGFVPLAVSIGFAATPSPLIATRLAGAAAGGVAALLTKSILASLSRSSTEQPSDSGGDGGGGGLSIPSTPTVVTAIDKLLSGPPITGMTLKKLEAVAKRSGVAPAQLGEFFTCVLAEALLSAVSTDSTDLMELGDITDFAKEIGFSEEEVGDAFSVAATRMEAELSKDGRGFFASAFPEQSLLRAAKLFFLADKLMGTFEGFYGKRFAVVLSFFTPEALKEVISAAGARLFKMCVSAVLSTPGKFSAEDVARLREFLSSSVEVSDLRPASMQNIIMESLQGALDRSLSAPGSSPLSVRIDDFEALKSSQEVLGWNAREFDATLETRTMPVFETAAQRIIEEALEQPERAAELAEQLQERIGALGVDVRRARVALTTLISAKNSEYMNTIEKVYNASGGSVEPVFKIMTSYANSHSALQVLSDKVMDGTAIPMPGLPFAEMIRVGLFRMQQLRQDASLSSDMFALNSAQQEIVKKNMALPKVTSWIAQCISEGAFSEDSKAAYRKLFRDTGITDEEWRPTSVDFYYQEVQRIASTRAVPSEVDMLRLAQLKAFLDCPADAVSRVNLELLGDKYCKAITEAMTPAGVITEEYLDGLERLRLRLGLAKADTDTLLGLVTRNRLAPLIKDLAEQWKSDTDANAREKGRKDKSGDPISSVDNVLGYMETGAQKYGGGPNVFMREALNLIDFVKENYLAAGADVSSESSELPVNAVGLQPQADLVEMYKHYLITALTEQDDGLKARYAANEDMFAKLLGIPEEGRAKVKESLAYSAYKNLLKSVLRVKDAVGADELRQFAVLKASLGLEQSTADRIFDECSRGAVIETAAAIMRSKVADINADTARRLRSQVQSLGLDMQKDTGFNERLVAYLYSLEVQYLIDNDMAEELQEIQQAYEIPEERAADIIEVSCVRYLSQILNFALRAAKKYNEVEAVKWGQQILKYAAYVSGKVDADGNMFTDSDKDRLVSFMSDELRTSGSEEEKMAVLRLKELINITDAFVPPLKGIDGLEGKIGESVGFDDGKKKWSWG